MARSLIGIVGYCPFVRAYPLGPELMERLQAIAWPGPVEIREMNWCPIAIVQDLQALPDQYDRVVLVGDVDRGLPAGTVRCQRWEGRVGDVPAVQRRMFEAVTGVIGVDNLLVIGAHFGVWPDRLFTVEVQLPGSSLGDLVLAEAEAQAKQGAGDGTVIGARALSPRSLALVERIVEACRDAAVDGATVPCRSLAANVQAPVAAVCHYDFLDQESAP